MCSQWTQTEHQTRFFRTGQWLHPLSQIQMVFTAYLCSILSIHTCIAITDIRMAVTHTGHTFSKRSSIGWVSLVSWCTRLTKLANISVWACALLYPWCLIASIETSSSSFKLNVINESNTCKIILITSDNLYLTDTIIKNKYLNCY